MTPRNDIVKIDAAFSNRQIEELVKKHPHTVYPVTDGSLDEILGTVSLEDLFGRLGEPGFSIRSALKPVHYFKDDTKVYNALEQMRELAPEKRDNLQRIRRDARHRHAKRHHRRGSRRHARSQ